MRWLVLQVGLAALFPSRTIRAELPNGAYLHERIWRRHDDNLVLRSPAGRIVLEPDVVRVQVSDSHVFLAHRSRGQRNANWRYLYDVERDNLLDCRPGEEAARTASSCGEILASEGFNLNPVGKWYDWHRLKVRFGRTWRHPGSGAGLFRALTDALPFSGSSLPGPTSQLPQ